MQDSMKITWLRVLFYFLNQEPEACTVSEIARRLEEGKQKISRLLMSMEKEGLIDREDVRQPRLTEEGFKVALLYETRFDSVLNHLLYEGLDVEYAEHDAYAWSLFSSEDGLKLIRNSEQQYRAKYELCNRTSFDGNEFCKHLADGEYRFPFVIYREHVRNGENISMANYGFAHPCRLRVVNGEGTICLQPLNCSGVSPHTHQKMTGHVCQLRYLTAEGFCDATEAENGELEFPAGALKFLNMGKGIGQIVHGSVCLRMRSSVGIQHMPESTAIFTLVI